MAENEKLTCPICGEPTRVYMGNARKDRLCGKHADMLKHLSYLGCLFDPKVIKVDPTAPILAPFFHLKHVLQMSTEICNTLRRVLHCSGGEVLQMR